MHIKVISDGVTTYNETISPTDTTTEASFSEVLETESSAIIAIEDETEVAEEGTMLAIFQEAAQTYGVDVNLLLAIAKQESGFDASATSSSGAQGIMQLMPATAESLGVEDAYDVYENIMGGAKYISQLLERYDGDVELALAAYTAGPDNVDKYSDIPPFAETQNYVTKVMAYYEEGVTIPDSLNDLTGATEDDTAQSAYEILSQINTLIQDRITYLQSQ